MLPTRRLIAGLVTAATTALTLAVAPPAGAAPDALPTYVLPGANVLPEGVAVLGGLYYATSTTTGAVYRGDLNRRRAAVFLPGGEHGRTQAIGLKATADRLIVAGGSTGLVSVYDRRSGALVAQFTNGASAQDPTFINDVALAPNGDAYITDSIRPVLYRIPAAALARKHAGRQPLRSFRSFTGTAFRYGPGFNANGIVVSADGRFAIVDQTSSGRLFRVTLAGDRAVRRVALGGRLVVSADGLVLLAGTRTLYVVRNATVGRIVEVQLDASYASGRVVDSLADPRFRSPSTAAVAGDRLLVVNSQFGGPGKPPFTLSSIPLL